jgi:16S rRNA (guanine966-N2)-methyltransferase
VFLDPPYHLEDDVLGAELAQLSDHEWLVPGAMVVVERASRSPEPAWPGGFTGTRQRKYGETTLWYGHAAGERPSEPRDLEAP